jgi:hypothetical protein
MELLNKIIVVLVVFLGISVCFNAILLVAYSHLSKNFDEAINKLLYYERRNNILLKQNSKF